MSLVTAVVVGLVLALVLGGIGVYLILRSRNMQIWLRSYLSRPPRPQTTGPVHVMFCFVVTSSDVGSRRPGHAAA